MTSSTDQFAMEIKALEIKTNKQTNKTKKNKDMGTCPWPLGVTFISTARSHSYIAFIALRDLALRDLRPRLVS